MITVRLDQVRTFTSGSLRIRVAPFTLSGWMQFCDDVEAIDQKDRHKSAMSLLECMQRAIVDVKYDDAAPDTPLSDLMTQFEIHDLAAFIGDINMVGVEDLGKSPSASPSSTSDCAGGAEAGSAASDTDPATTGS